MITIPPDWIARFTALVEAEKRKMSKPRTLFSGKNRLELHLGRPKDVGAAAKATPAPFNLSPERKTEDNGNYS